jgi:hypothetical protein
MLSLLLLACAPEIEEARRCNGASELCDRRLDEVTFPATHNSMSSTAMGYLPPNHTYAVPRQLSDGVRGLNLDTHSWEGGLWLCHGFCDLGRQPLVEGLAEVTTFLDTHPDEVLIITFQDGISGEETRGAVTEAGLDAYAHTHVLGEPWPTLRELIDAGERVVLFSASGGGVSWHHSQWEHWIDNPYSAEKVSDFSCEDDRGERSTATLYNINHFLTAPVALESLAEEANTWDAMWGHVSACVEETGRHPSQVLVDFYSTGALLEVVDALNGL